METRQNTLERSKNFVFILTVFSQIFCDMTKIKVNSNSNLKYIVQNKYCTTLPKLVKFFGNYFLAFVLYRLQNEMREH